MPDLVDRIAVEIHDPPSGGIDQPDTLRPLEHVEARGRECLAQKHALIRGEQFPRRRVDLRARPFGSRRREIDVALAAIGRLRRVMRCHAGEVARPCHHRLQQFRGK
jgi:hypothetical protein